MNESIQQNLTPVISCTNALLPLPAPPPPAGRGEAGGRPAAEGVDGVPAWWVKVIRGLAEAVFHRRAVRSAMRGEIKVWKVWKWLGKSLPGASLG